jgi:hypothetical protein
VIGNGVSVVGESVASGVIEGSVVDATMLVWVAVLDEVGDGVETGEDVGTTLVATGADVAVAMIGVGLTAVLLVAVGGLFTT